VNSSQALPQPIANFLCRSRRLPFERPLQDGQMLGDVQMLKAGHPPQVEQLLQDG
jgi:hypothetical protein